MKLGAVKWIVAAFAISLVAYGVHAWTRIVDRATTDAYTEKLRDLATLDARLRRLEAGAGGENLTLDEVYTSTTDSIKKINESNDQTMEDIRGILDAIRETE